MLQTGESNTPHTSKAGLISWALYDWANSGFPAVIQTFVFAAYFTRQIAVNEATGSAQWGNTISAAGFIVAILGPILGAIADQKGRRKPWIFGFTMLCVLATGMLWFAEPTNDVLVFALLMVGLGTLGSEFAFIFYNAMLPSLVPQKRMGRWSGWAWGLGYAGGLACLGISLTLILPEQPVLGLDRSNAEHLRLTFVIVAAWYLLFSLPLFLKTPDVPATGKNLSEAVQSGWKQIKASLKNVRKFKNIVRFLIARIFFIDGLATVFAFGGVYAAGTFDMTEQEVLFFGIGLNVTAGLGAAAFAWLDDWFGSKKTIIVSLVGLIIPTVIVLLVSNELWFWIFGMLLGIFVGPVQAASRTFMAHLAPRELRNQMFGLLALSGKVTAFMGPLLVGWLSYWSGSQRIGMSIIVIFFVIGLLMMFTVDQNNDSSAVTNK